MAYTYEDFLSFLPGAGLSESDFSAEDLAMAKQNPQAGVDLMEAKFDWKNAKTDDERAMANARANQIREQYGGYSGGIDGKNGNVTLTYDDAPEYTGDVMYDSYTNDDILGNYNQSYDPIAVQQGAVNNPYDEHYADPYTDPYGAGGGVQTTLPANKYQTTSAQAPAPAYQYEEPVARNTTPTYQYQAPATQQTPAYQYQAPVQDADPYMEGYKDPYEITNTPASYQAGPAPGPFSYDKTASVYQSTGTYNNQYADQQKQLLGDVTNYKPFEFDPETNAQMQAYTKQYRREGNRAMQDTIGSLSAATGGIPSTAVASAAGQANNYYMSQLGDKLPQIYASEFDKYMQEFGMAKDKIGAVNTQENIDYSKYWDGEQFNWNKFLSDRDQYNTDRGQAFNEYQSDLGQYNTDRNFGYGQAIDDINYRTGANDTAYERAYTADATKYGRGRDAVSDANYAQEQYRLSNETEYGRGRDAVSDANYAQEQYRLANETEYGRGRDSVADQNYTQEQNRLANETDYNRDIYAGETDYQHERDLIGDEQFAAQEKRIAEQDEFDRKYKIDEQNASTEATKYNRAIDRFEMMGYADAQTAKDLGVKEGSVWGGEAAEIALQQSKLNLEQTQAKGSFGMLNAMRT